MESYWDARCWLSGRGCVRSTFGGGSCWSKWAVESVPQTELKAVVMRLMLIVGSSQHIPYASIWDHSYCNRLASHQTIDYEFSSSECSTRTAPTQSLRVRPSRSSIPIDAPNQRPGGGYPRWARDTVSEITVEFGLQLRKRWRAWRRVPQVR